MPTKLPRVSISLRPEEQETITRAAERAGLSLSRYLVVCAEQVARPNYGLHSRLRDKDNRVEGSLRSPRGVFSVRALVIYKRPPERLTLLADPAPARHSYVPRRQWIPYARVGDVAVWETTGPFRVAAVGLDTLEPFAWYGTEQATVDAVTALLRANGR